MEPNEGYPGDGGTIWWSWMSPADGFYAVHLSAEVLAPGWADPLSNFHPPSIQISRGSTVLEARSIDSWVTYCAGFEDRTILAASAGATFQLSLLGSPSDGSRYKFIIEPVAGPVIIEHPRPEFAIEGGSAAFIALSQLLASPRPVQKQWQLNGVDLPGQNRSMLFLPRVTAADAGWYRMILTWPLPDGGTLSVTSQVASLVVKNVSQNQNLVVENVIDSNRNYFLKASKWDGAEFVIEASADLYHWREASDDFARRHWQRSTNAFVWDYRLGKQVPAWDNLQDRWALTLRCPQDNCGTGSKSKESRFFRIRMGWSDRQVCQNQLRLIHMAKRAYAADNKRVVGDATDNSEVNSNLRGPLTCPAGGEYSYGAVGDIPTCTLPDHVWQPSTP